MSRAIEDRRRGREWGPAHQQISAPWQRERSPVLRLVGWFLAAMFLHTQIDNGGGDAFAWCLNVMVLGWLAKRVIQGVREDRIPIGWLVRVACATASWIAVQFARTAPIAVLERIPAFNADPQTWRPEPVSPAQQARYEVERLGGGAYLGEREDGEWVCADPESAVMVLGPPRSGKTSAVMIPALLGAPGAAVSTSTKPDVMRATRRARSELGRVWLFDPAGREGERPPSGVRRLRWSPVAAAGTWDRALMTARAMSASAHAGKGTSNEGHWRERAGALLAPLLYAASLTGRPIEDVLHWTLRQDTTVALEVLAGQHGHETAANVLAGIERTDTRERSSIFSATAGVLAAYNADATRASARDPNFDPREFAKSTDTVYITAPEHRQAQCAPLIVGLLEQIRHAVYEDAGRRVGRGVRQPMLWALDEVANIAPIHDLPALVSQAGGQGLQVLVGLQDLSQARGRWGEAAAEGFMSLFQTRLVLNGIADPRTLESISLALGEYDRTLVSASAGTSESEQWLAPRGRSESVSCHTQSRRMLTPGEIASLPRGHGLLLQGGAWELIRLTPWHRHQGWADVAHNSIYG
jgi:type IV secretory pathway TraG/TraD family ATPase VirD4